MRAFDRGRSFLGGLCPPYRRATFVAGLPREFHAGEVVFLDGPTTSHAVLITEALVKLTAISAGGHETLLWVRGGGESARRTGRAPRRPRYRPDQLGRVQRGGRTDSRRCTDGSGLAAAPVLRPPPRGLRRLCARAMRTAGRGRMADRKRGPRQCRPAACPTALRPRTLRRPIPARGWRDDRHDDPDQTQPC